MEPYIEKYPRGSRGSPAKGVGRLRGARVRIPSSLPYSLGPLVKWLRHRPFTAVTRVRIPYGSFEKVSNIFDTFFLYNNIRQNMSSGKKDVVICLMILIYFFNIFSYNNK